MTKADIANLIKERIGSKHEFAKRDVSLKVINLILDGLFEVLKENIARGEHIELRGFGSFETKIREAKTIVTPKTKKLLNVKKHAIPIFKSGRELRQKVREYFEKKIIN